MHAHTHTHTHTHPRTGTACGSATDDVDDTSTTSFCSSVDEALCWKDSESNYVYDDEVASEAGCEDDDYDDDFVEAAFGIIIGAAIAGVVVICGIVTVIICCCCKKNNNNNSQQVPTNPGQVQMTNIPTAQATVVYDSHL